jgi:DNA-binding transcriptional MerR regulator
MIFFKKMADNKKTYLTIGELVKKFKNFYPDLSNSKLRFLESRGLIVTKRADNNYRVYFKNDVKKINLILSLQKDYFMPLEIIKEKIDSIDFEKIEEQKGVLQELQAKFAESDRSLKIKKLSIEEIREKFKLSHAHIEEIFGEGLIQLHKEDGKNIVDGQDIEILRVITELQKYGIHVRHLKIFENSAVRHSTFLQQVVYPVIMSSGKESRKKGAKISYRLEALFNQLHEMLFKKENKKFLDNYK